MTNVFVALDALEARLRRSARSRISPSSSTPSTPDILARKRALADATRMIEDLFFSLKSSLPILAELKRHFLSVLKPSRLARIGSPSLSSLEFEEIQLILSK